MEHGHILGKVISLMILLVNIIQFMRQLEILMGLIMLGMFLVYLIEKEAVIMIWMKLTFRKLFRRLGDQII